MWSKLIGLATGKFGRAIGRTLIGGVVLIAGWWAAQKLEALGRLEAQLASSESSLEALSTQNEALRSEIADLSTAIFARARKAQDIEARFAELRASAQEVKDACTDQSLPGVAVEQLRLGSQALTGEGGRAELPDNPAGVAGPNPAP